MPAACKNEGYEQTKRGKTHQSNCPCSQLLVRKVDMLVILVQLANLAATLDVYAISMLLLEHVHKFHLWAHHIPHFILFVRLVVRFVEVPELLHLDSAFLALSTRIDGPFMQAKCIVDVVDILEAISHSN